MNKERLSRNGIGLGEPAEDVSPPSKTSSQWGVAIATSVIGAATGWVIEEVARNVRKKHRR